MLSRDGQYLTTIIDRFQKRLIEYLVGWVWAAQGRRGMAVMEIIGVFYLNRRCAE